jgi:predicted DCC family thiol-disulfide oxidoreductase YuxK
MGYTLVYDPECGPCARFRDVVGFLDPGHRMRYLGVAEAEGRDLLSGVPEPMRRRSFHLVSDSGAALSGAGAIATLASLLPGGVVASAAVGSNPLLSRAVGFAYATFSRLHDAGSCRTSDGNPPRGALDRG